MYYLYLVHSSIDNYYAATSCSTNDLTLPFLQCFIALLILFSVVRGCMRMNLVSNSMYARRCLVTMIALWIVCYIEVYVLIDWYYRHHLKKTASSLAVFSSMAMTLCWVFWEWVQDIPAWFLKKSSRSQLGWFWIDPDVNTMTDLDFKNYNAKCMNRVRSCYIMMMYVIMMHIAVPATLEYLVCARVSTHTYTAYGLAIVCMGVIKVLKDGVLRQRTYHSGWRSWTERGR
jgi:hypothetical protein